MGVRQIGGVDLSRQVLVVAEIGNNHEGDVALAEEMVGLAAEAGADAVKFQTLVPQRLVSPDNEKRLQQLERFRLTHAEFRRLAELAEEKGILFLSTPFDLGSVDFLDALVPAYKVASGDNTFYPLLEAIAATGKPILLSTGMADLETVRRSVRCIQGAWGEGAEEAFLVLLHCVSSYPVPPDQANLAAIRELSDLDSAAVGYSDHTLGVDAAVLSVALGARVVEKHFTLAKDHSDFRDHRLSADPDEMARLVNRIREAETLLGEGRKVVMDAEREIRSSARRSIAAARDLEPGDVLQFDDFTWLRPSGGIPPGQEKKLVGRRVKRPISHGEWISEDDLAER